MSGRLGQLKSIARREGWERFICTENDERAMLEGCYVDERWSQRVATFARTFCVHTIGSRHAGQPFELLPVQYERIIGPLFGWRRADGRRRFTSADIWMAKKNGKSALCGVLTLYFFIGDGEAGAEIYCAANDRSQTKRVFEPALTMVQKSRALSARVTPIPSQYRMILRDDRMSCVQALSCEERVAEGLNAHAIIFDELHAFDERGRKRFLELAYASSARVEPMRLVISTAGSDALGIGYEQYEFSRDVLNGVRANTGHFVYIAEPGKEALPGTDAAIEAANPLLGVTVQLDEIRSAYTQSEGRPAERHAYMRYRENRWVFQRPDPWLALEDWDRGADEFEPSPGAVCYGGLDLAAKYDLTAWAMCFPLDDGTYGLRLRFWLPDEQVQAREENDRLPYRAWADAGWLTLTPGPTTDYEFVEQQIVDDAATYNLVDFGFDPAFARRSAQRLQDEFGLRLFEFTQTPGHYTEPCKLFHECVLGGRLRHGGNPILRVHASQVAVRTDAGGRIMPMKADRNRRWYHIDGIVAALMAFQRCTANESEAGAIPWVVQL